MTDDITSLNAGIDAADGPDKAQEHADVAAWTGRIKSGRKFDADARKQYAKDRRYARGDSGFKVDSNLIGTNIDILETFLYAKDPDVDVLPAKNVTPPTMDSIIEAAEESLKGDMEAQQLLQQEAQAMIQQGAAEVAIAGAAAGLPAMPAAPDPAAFNAALVEVTQAYLAAKVEEVQTMFAKRKRDAEAYAETLEIVISRLWVDASLKARGRRFVRSGLTIGVGILKASWQERTAPSPETVAAINDLQDNIKRAAATRAELDEASGAELDAKTAEYERQLANLKGQAEQVIARGFVVDLVAGEDFQIPPGYQIASHCDAPWNAHRIPMQKSEAMAHFGLDKDTIKQATVYSARKPEMVRTESAMVDMGITELDADAYVQNQQGDDGGEWVMPWEIWDRDSNTVLTLIEGVKCWVKPAWQPTATTRFYPFFLYTTSEVDGQRHPQSLTSRSAKLVDEYNRIGTAEAEHRARCIPKTMFNRGRVSVDTIKRLENGVTAEMVGVDLTMPTEDLVGLFAPVGYPPIDPALYDRSRIVNELERIWGIQEALSGSVSTAKTATEAEIQQGGFTARTGGRRDLLEICLQDMAQYTAENARAHLDAEDVRKIAGPDALWPEYKGAADLADMVQIEIRAGSSGKPNTTADREAWAQQLPILQNGIIQIGQMRNSLPTDVADCLEQLLRITAERSGDRMNIDQLMPKPGPPPMPMDPNAPPVEGEPTPDPIGATNGP